MTSIMEESRQDEDEIIILDKKQGLPQQPEIDQFVRKIVAESLEIGIAAKDVKLRECILVKKYDKLKLWYLTFYILSRCTCRVCLREQNDNFFLPFSRSRCL